VVIERSGGRAAAQSVGGVGIRADLAVMSLAPPLLAVGLGAAELRNAIALLKTSAYGMALDGALDPVAMLCHATAHRTNFSGPVLRPR
jgi:hypothetical protein